MGQKFHEESYTIAPLGGGINDNRNQSLIDPRQTPRSVNIEYDRDSILSSAGSYKYGNQEAPHSALRTKAPDSLPHLQVASGVSVPLRGYGYFPYSRNSDIGGSGPSGFTQNEVPLFHHTRGRSFGVSFSFRFDADELFYKPAAGIDSGRVNFPGNPDVIATSSVGSWGVTLDECTILVQKGGDRMTPMSWAIGVVDVANKFQLLTGEPLSTASQYLPVFMWLDAPQWGYPSGPTGTNLMAYELSSGVTYNGAPGGTFSTQALRAVIAKHGIQPGVRYHVSVDLALDSGTPGGEFEATAWANDGAFSITVAEEYGDPVRYTSGNGLLTYKGPTDSIEYMEKYGVRYTGRDALFAGMGARQIPVQPNGNLVYGADAAALERGGHKMLDLSATPAPPGLSLTLEKDSGPGFSYLKFNHRWLTFGNTSTGWSPIGLSGASFRGLEVNPDALRNYWAMTYQSTRGDQWNGARFLLGAYSEVGGEFRIEANLGTIAGQIGPRACAISPFRWRQRPFTIEGLIVRDRAINYVLDKRARLTLKSHVDLADETEPNRETIVAYWPLTDAGQGSLEELISGNTGYAFPFNCQCKDGSFALSGEGEALVLDFSENPVIERHVRNLMQAGGNRPRGLAIEVTCKLPEAYYAIDEVLSDGSVQGQYAPDILAWEVKDTTPTGLAHTVNPILRFTHRARWAGPTIAPVRFPMGFHARYHRVSDQEDVLEEDVFNYYDTSGNTPRLLAFDENASWVGQRLTFQIGIQSGGSPGTFDVYLAGHPKFHLKPSTGDTPDTEIQYWTKAITITAKEFAHSVVTIGGAWHPRGRGYPEINCRMIVEDVRVFGTGAPGPLTSVDGTGTNDGKIVGIKAFRRGTLRDDELTVSLGEGVTTVDLVRGSSTVSAPTGTRFHTANARDTKFAIKGAYLAVAGDRTEIREEQELPSLVLDYYRIVDVAADGSSLTLDTVYRGQSRTGALAQAFRLIGYTALDDNLDDTEISLGRGDAFRVGETFAEDVILTDELWRNRLPISVNWRLRIYTPLGGVAAEDVVPGWARGVKNPRRNPILGLRQKRGTRFCGVQGAIYEVDDRWRKTDGPSDALSRSIFFRGRETDRGVSIPEARDYLRMDAADAHLDLAGDTLGHTYDIWIKPERISGVQTLWWAGDTASEVRRPGQLWARLRDGQPELGVGSISTTAGSLPLGQPVFASGDVQVVPGRWTHIRWQLGSFNSQELADPKLFVNGKPIEVRVLTRVATSPRAWINKADIPQYTSGHVFAIGAARYIADTSTDSIAHAHDAESGLSVRPGRYLGYIHGFRGLMSGFVFSRADGLYDQGGFDHFTESPSVTFRFRMQEGVGHIVGGGSKPAIVQSSPFLSRKHDMGEESERFSFASFLNRMYVANGGRVAYVDDESSGFAGLLKPTTTPKFDIERVPLLKENVQLASPNGAENDPVRATGANKRLLHFNTQGNNYLVQNFHEEMAWEFDNNADAPQYDIVAFKCYIRMRSVNGRIPLYSARDNVNSGGFFVEVRDGRVYAGWYDSLLKREVWVRTSNPVIEPGFVHYVHVRKQYPSGRGWVGTDPTPAASHEGVNWSNSIAWLSSDYTNDLMIVRRFPKQTKTLDQLSELDATIHASNRNCISFTTEDVSRPAGTTAAGLVSDPLVTFTGGVNGAVTGSQSVFRDDMTGMFFQFGSGAGAFSGKTYRIVGVPGDGPTVAALAELGTTTQPDFTGVTGANGGVFTGITLEKSDFFDESQKPDDGVYATELFGSKLASDIGNGISPFDGEYWSVAYYTAYRDGDAMDPEDVNIFEPFNATDRITTGTDFFPEDIFDPTLPSMEGPGPGELLADGGATFTEINCYDVATVPKPFPVTPQPNEERSVDPGDLSSVNADTLFWRFIDEPDTAPGPTRISVVFYDRDQDILSNPGPDLVVNPRQEDITNSSGDFRVTLRNLPVSRDVGRIERWIYASLPGGSSKFLVAQVPDNTSSAVAVNPSPLAIARSQRVLEFTNNAPPRCKVLGVSQGSLWYGNLQGAFDQEDGVVFSKPFFPAQIPASNFLPLIGEGTGGITAMGNLKGRMIIYKRDAAWRVTLDNAFPVSELVTTGIGCVAMQSLVTLDDRHYFVSDRGPCVYLGQGLPVWVAHNLKTFYTERLDERRAQEASGAVNRRRNQYVVTAVESGASAPGRVSTEYDSETSGAASGTRQPARYRFGRYEEPDLTAIGNVQPESGSVQELVGGTSEGFVVALDQAGTRGVLRGEGPAWGARTGVVQAGATASQIPIVWDRGDVPDPYLAGVRGQPVRVSSSGVEQSSAALWADAGLLLLDRSLGVAPLAGDVVSVGVPLHQWETGWLDLGESEKKKQIKWIDLVCEKESSGSITIEVFTDYDDDDVKYTSSVDLTTARPRFEANPCGFHFKIRLRTSPGTDIVNFEVTHLVVRWQRQEQT